MNKNYIITGANGELGCVLSKYLIEEKECNVLCVTRSEQELLFKGNYRQIKGIDLLKKESLQALVSEAKTYFDGSFHIINCVGYYEKGQQEFINTEIEEANKIMALNYTTVYNTATTLISIQKERGGGHFIAFTCDSTNHFYPLMAPYIAAKSALNALIKCLANEFFEHNIFSNAFSLATIKEEKEKRNKPKGDFINWIEPKEIAEKVYELSQVNNLVSGNLIKLYNYSESFFHQSYFDRVSKE